MLSYLTFGLQPSVFNLRTGFIPLASLFSPVSQVAHLCRRVAVLEKLLRTSHLKIEDVQAARTAFRAYQKGKADFADCLLGATNRLGGCDETVTFDHAAGKLEGFQLI